MKTFRRNGVYRRRFMWWYPWGVTGWWQPRVFRGGDEWCNDSAALVAPPLGAFILFWRPGRLRTMPCAEEWAWLNDDERADYAPCGYLYGGRVRYDAHHHFETGVCETARKWLDLGRFSSRSR